MPCALLRFFWLLQAGQYYYRGIQKAAIGSTDKNKSRWQKGKPQHEGAQVLAQVAMEGTYNGSSQASTHAEEGAGADPSTGSSQHNKRTVEDTATGSSQQNKRAATDTGTGTSQEQARVPKLKLTAVAQRGCLTERPQWTRGVCAGGGNSELGIRKTPETFRKILKFRGGVRNPETSGKSQNFGEFGIKNSEKPETFRKILIHWGILG